MVNKFGQNKGFDRMLKRMKDRENWLGIEMVQRYLKFMGNLHAVFYKEFALEFLPKFISATLANIMKSPEWNLKKFTKQLIANISDQLELLAKRCMSLGEKNQVPPSTTFHPY